MNKKQICTFCTNKGIPGPHNHTVRLWTHPDKPIIVNVISKINVHFAKYLVIQNNIVPHVRVSIMQMSIVMMIIVNV